MPQFLLELGLNRPAMNDGPTESELALVVQHHQYWENLTDSGTALVVGRTQDPTPNGYAIFLADSIEHAELIAELDPAVNEIFNYVVRPYRVALLGSSERFKP